MRKGSEELRLQSQNQLEIVSKEEILAWYEHPCTQALKLALEGDYIEVIEEWANGTYTDNTAEGTAMLNAKALAQAQSIDSVVDWMEDLKSGDLFEGGTE